MPATATWQRPLELLRSRTGVEAALVAVRSLSKPCSSTTARKRSDRARAGPQPSNDAMRCLKQALGLLSDTNVTSRKTLYTICESILDYLMAMGGDTAGLFVRASLSVVNHALDDGLVCSCLKCFPANTKQVWRCVNVPQAGSWRIAGGDGECRYQGR